jgi:hypothetical protein
VRIARVLAAGLVLALAPAVRAAPCGRPDLLYMVPPDGALDVPTNATLSAYYQSSADYLGEDVVLVTPDGVENALPATFDATEGKLSITPPDPLTSGGPYLVRWPALRGLNAATPGLGDEARFSVAFSPDTQPPSFAGLAGIRWDLQRETDECTDSIEQRFIFDLELDAANDDGGRDGLTLIVFQTDGPGAKDGSVPVLTRALPTTGSTVRVALPTEDAVGQVCFAALVRDTTGQVSNSADREVCVTTTDPPFFRGCSIATPGTGLASLVWAGAALAAAARRRRGRPRP